jgi:hypothetical protein
VPQKNNKTNKILTSLLQIFKSYIFVNCICLFDVLVLYKNTTLSRSCRAL